MLRRLQSPATGNRPRAVLKKPGSALTGVSARTPSAPSPVVSPTPPPLEGAEQLRSTAAVRPFQSLCVLQEVSEVSDVQDIPPPPPTRAGPGVSMAGLQEALVVQLEAAQRMLASNHMQAVGLVATRLMAFAEQSEALEVLRQENSTLRVKMGIMSSLGTLDVSTPPSGVSVEELLLRPQTSPGEKRARGRLLAETAPVQAPPASVSPMTWWPSSGDLEEISQDAPPPPETTGRADDVHRPEEPLEERRIDALDGAAERPRKMLNSWQVVGADDTSEDEPSTSSHPFGIVHPDCSGGPEPSPSAGEDDSVRPTSEMIQTKSLTRSRACDLDAISLKPGVCAPKVFVPHEIWSRRLANGRTDGKSLFGWRGSERDGDSRSSVGTVSSQASSPNKKRIMDSFDTMVLPPRALTYASRWILHPYSKRRVAWDIFSLMLVLYDMISIPLMFFEPESSVLDAMEWVTRIFWTLDVPASVVSGYVTADGNIELRAGQIIRNYVKTWLALDICIVGSDWAGMAVNGSALQAAGVSKASRIIRIIRLMRLLRLIRMREVVAGILERFKSEKLIILAELIKLMTLMIGLAHLLACCWYGLSAEFESESTAAWVVEYGFGQEVRLSKKYLMSLHWSLSQFAGGMDEITPVNDWERFFSICVFCMAFIVASAFVSSVTSSMTQLYFIGSQQSAQLSLLRRYMAQNKITKRLALRIQRNAQHMLIQLQESMSEDKVVILSVVSEPLKVELHFELYRDKVSCHHFFRKYLTECPQVMRRVCHSAIVYTRYSPGDVIFDTGENPKTPTMYFVIQGELEYAHVSGLRSSATVTHGEWLSEAVLWTSWTHRGCLTATTDCLLTLVDAQQFQDIVSQFEHGDFNPADYAHDFVTRLNREHPNDISDLGFSDD